MAIFRLIIDHVGRDQLLCWRCVGISIGLGTGIGIGIAIGIGISIGIHIYEW